MTTPTTTVATALEAAFRFFNRKLFSSELPDDGVYITLHRHKGAYGYFRQSAFKDGEQKTIHEIALNHDHLSRPAEEVLSTLVHEMVHLWQREFGTKLPPRPYHNKEFQAKMLSVGLIVSSTGAPGGKVTGVKMSHYTDEDGPYKPAVKEFLESSSWLDIVGQIAEAPAKKGKKRQSRKKYTCPECGQNAWAAYKARLACGECEIMLVEEDGGEDDDA